VVYADDLNAYREFVGTVPNDEILESAKLCQEDLHAWGRANQVAFDPAKESMHVLSATSPQGSNFVVLGIDFDCGLQMSDAVHGAVTEAGWKLKTLLRTSKFYNDSELVLLYKSHLLSAIEYKTPSIYHARRVDLVRLDSVQQKFLRETGVDELTALRQFSLAPLSTRRDIAMLGMIHRTVLRKGPPHFREHFKPEGLVRPGEVRRHRRHLVDPRDEWTGRSVARSVLGLVAVYNLLPDVIAKINSISAFQSALQKLVLDGANHGVADWQALLCPRQPLATPPLLTAPGGGAVRPQR
jgi:hypothetical protein